MNAEPGWHLDPESASWREETKSLSFLLCKRERHPVLCTITMGALLKTVPLTDVSEVGLRRIFDAHRQLIELRAAEKLNAGLTAADGSVRLDADDFAAERAKRGRRGGTSSPLGQ